MTMAERTHQPLYCSEIGCLKPVLKDNLCAEHQPHNEDLHRTPKTLEESMHLGSELRKQELKDAQPSNMYVIFDRFYNHLWVPEGQHFPPVFQSYGAAEFTLLHDENFAAWHMEGTYEIYELKLCDPKTTKDAVPFDPSKGDGIITDK